MKRISLSCVVILVFAVQIASSQVPQTMSYQGLLTNTSGTPVPDGNYSLTFRLYTAGAGGAALWTETHSLVTVVKGIFNVILGGAAIPTPLTLPFDQQYWLSIQVGAGLELAPRVKLTSSAYSLNSRSVADGAVTNSKIADNAVTTAKILPNVVSSVDGVSNDGGDIDLVSGSNIAITSNDGANTITISAPDVWRLYGNADTTPGTHFLGTTDNRALELKVNNTRILRLEPNATSPNIIGGFNGNSITSGVIGAVITGGGKSEDLNLITDYHSTIGGGAGNQAGNNDGDVNNAYYNTVGGGHRNKATGQYAFIGGGQENEASALFATVGGGGSNKATGGSATVGGGQNNAAVGFATVSGGNGNRATVSYATVCGGEYNKAGSSHATVSGGRYNEASGSYTTIGGGRYNKTSASYATIGGGGTSVFSNIYTANRVTDEYGTVSGGGNNQAGDADDDSGNKPYATVGGGKNNEAIGAYATVPGGSDNSANGSYSFAIGRRAKADFNGCFVWGDSVNADIASTANDQFVVRANGGVYFSDSQEMRISDNGDVKLVLEADMNNSGESDNPGILFTQDGGIVQGFLGYAEGTNRLILENRYSDQLMLKSPGGIYLYTNAGETTGMYLAAGGSGWNAVSDRAMKANIRPVGVKDILDRLSSIPISQWSYKTQVPSVEHIGPMAQEWKEAFGLGDDDKSINSIDADGVALAAIQGLYEIVKEKDAKIASLEARLAALEARAK